MKPVIGITCNYDYRDDVGIASHMGPENQDWNFIAADYVRAVEEGGGIPVLIPQCKSLEEIEEILSRLDGVLLSGGHDVNPAEYGQRVKKYCGTLMPMRDRQDIAVVKKAFEKKLPMLGICRGMQIMAVAFGGTMYQDLGAEGDYEEHFTIMLPRNIASHTIHLQENSRIHSIFGEEQIDVNSFHHQAVCKAPENASVTESSEDQVVEALEFNGGHPFTMGVQWHPEMMYDSDSQKKLFETFVDACKH